MQAHAGGETLALIVPQCSDLAGRIGNHLQPLIVNDDQVSARDASSHVALHKFDTHLAPPSGPRRSLDLLG
jgi:hypothetical protein